MFKLKVLVPALLGLLVVGGCGSSNAMVGTWKMEITPEVQKQIDEAKKVMPDMKLPEMTMTFKADNTVDATMTMGDTKNTASGTYSIDGKNLKVKMTTEDGKPSKNSREETATLSDDMKSFTINPGMGQSVKMVKQ